MISSWQPFIGKMPRPFVEYIPLSHRFVFDSVVWLNNKNGMYSIQSRYHVARKVLREENRVENSKDPIGQQVWRNLWKLWVPYKIKVFGWRAYQEIQ